MYDKAVVLPIQPEELDYYWPFVSNFIESAIEHTDNEVNLEDIRSDIATEQRQLFVIKENDRYIAAVVTMIYTTISGVKIGDITFAGGSAYDRWDHFVDIIKPFFQENDCRFIDIPGRRGWVKKFKDRGFREAYVVMRMEISNVKGQQKDNVNVEFNAKYVGTILSND